MLYHKLHCFLELTAIAHYLEWTEKDIVHEEFSDQPPVLNALAVDENNDGTPDQELRPGSEEDIESMIRIMAIISSLYNWLMMLVTILLVICLIYDTKIFKFWKFNERRERKLQKIPEEEDEIAKLHARLQALKS